jgi:hypothetical protein
MDAAGHLRCLQARSPGRMKRETASLGFTEAQQAGCLRRRVRAACWGSAAGRGAAEAARRVGGLAGVFRDTGFWYYRGSRTLPRMHFRRAGPEDATDPRRSSFEESR